MTDDERLAPWRGTDKAVQDAILLALMAIAEYACAAYDEAVAVAARLAEAIAAFDARQSAG